eukprot:gene1195-1377_t
MSVPASEAITKIFTSIGKQSKKGQNFFDVCFSLPDRGVGHRLTKKVWPSRNTYWTVTKISFGKNSRRVVDILDKSWTTFPYEMPPKVVAEPLATDADSIDIEETAQQ